MTKGLILFCLTILVSTTLYAQDATTYTKVGDKAPAFMCVTLDGKTIDINALKGKVILVNFFATWCPPCNQELPVLQTKVFEKYKDNKNFVLVILGREHSEGELREWVVKKGFIMPFAADPERKIYSLYAKETIPRNVIIGRNGNIEYQSTGYTPDEFAEMEKKLSELLK